MYRSQWFRHLLVRGRIVAWWRFALDRGGGPGSSLHPPCKFILSTLRNIRVSGSDVTANCCCCCLQFSCKPVAQVAVDMLLLLCDHLDILLAARESLCRRIIDVSICLCVHVFILPIAFKTLVSYEQSMCTAIHCLLASTEKSNSLEDKRVAPYFTIYSFIRFTF